MPADIHWKKHPAFQNIPKRVLTRRISYVFIGIIGLLVVLFFVPFPQTHTLSGQLRTIQRPLPILCPTQAQIVAIYANTEDTLYKSQPLLRFAHTGHWPHIQSFLQKMNRADSLALLNFDGDLGTLTLPFLRWQQARQYLSYLLQTIPIQTQQRYLNQQITRISQIEAQIDSQQQLIQTEIANYTRQYQRLQQLFKQAQGATSLLELEHAENRYLRAQRTASDLQTQYAQLQQQRQNVYLQFDEKQFTYTQQLKKAQQEVATYWKALLQAAQSWQQTYLLHAPKAGFLHWTLPIDTGLWLAPQTTIGQIHPPIQHTEYFIEVYLPAKQRQQIKIGQTAKIILEEFPQKHYGHWTGTVQKISTWPTPKGYLTQIQVKEAQNKKGHPFPHREMLATAEIQLERISLWEKLWKA